MAKTNVKGMDKVLANLEKEIRKVEGRSVGGLLLAGNFLLGKSQPEVPVEYGPLKASGFARKHPNNAQAVQVGYRQAYALFVHENTEEKLRGKPRPSGLGTYWNPGGSKFLERPLNENWRDMINIVANRANMKNSGENK